MEEPTSNRNQIPASFSIDTTVKKVNDSLMSRHDDKEEVVKNEDEQAGRERLKRHREEVAGQVTIPEKWGQEQLMKDWIDLTAFDALLGPHRVIVVARDALIADGRKARSQRLRIQSSC